MRTAILAVMAAATTLAGCATYGDDRYRSYAAYDYDRVDPSYNGYYADRYYVDNARYRERRLSRNDRVYVGQDGRYYCRRNDGTTGLIVGGIAGGALGAARASLAIDPVYQRALQLLQHTPDARGVFAAAGIKVPAAGGAKR